MIKDDMSDDAEFDAFLKGEGALARQLQALDQPSPSPALDAAILANARTALADARPAAANDAAPASQRTVPGQLSWRWRVPAGIAATLLVGLIARQSFESDQGQPRYDVPVAEVAVPAAAVEADRAPAVPPAPQVPVSGQVTASADNAAPPPALKRREEKPGARAQVAPVESAPAPAQVAEVTPAPVAEPPPPPAPAAAPAPPPAPVEVRARPSPAPMMMPAPAPAPAPMAPPAAASAKPSMDALLERPVTVSGSRIASATLQEVAADEQRAAERTASSAKQQRSVQGRVRGFNATGLDKPAAPVESAAVMLERVERLIQEGKQEAAFEAWDRLRRFYPQYPVPDSVREKMDPPPQVPDMR